MVSEAIILAAGMGTRLKPLTVEKHKCLTEVNGVPILENALKILEETGCKRVVLVVGYLKGQIMEKVGKNFGRMQVLYAENDIFSSTNTSFSLKKGLDRAECCGEMLVLEGDVFFEKKVLLDLLECDMENMTVLEKYRPDLDGTFVEINEDGFVVDWVHKSQRQEGYILENKYKTVNIHKFDSVFTNGILKEYLEDSISKFHGKEPLENVMMRIVRDNPDCIKGMVLDGQKWFEIDDLHDLEIAERTFRS